MDERTFVDRHGVEVSTRWWPVDDPRAVVLLSHGASEHSGRYDRFARALGSAGLAAAAVDHRGHGRTGGGGGPALMGEGGGQAVVDDLDELRAAVAADLGAEVPVVLFGHSLGALIGVTYLTQHSSHLAGAVLCGFPAAVADAAATGEVLRAVVDQLGRDEPAANLLGDNNAAFEPARTSFDWLSRDPDEVDRYIADPLCGDANPLTYGFLVDLLDVVGPAAERLDAIACPVLVIAGDHDPAAAMGEHATTLAAALDRAGVATDLTIYPDARHELLNETNRDEVTADVLAWIEQVL